MRQFIFIIFILLVACDDSSDGEITDSMDTDSMDIDSPNEDDTGISDDDESDDSQDTEPTEADSIDTEEPTGLTGVYFEVESIPPVAPWVEETIYDDYSGTSYFRWPDVADNSNGITANQDAALVYEFSVGTSGTYLVEVRGRRDHEGWCTDAADDACNDVWVKMDDGDWIKKMIKQGTWGEWIWDGKWEPGGSVITTEIQLNAGRHTYRISGRSNGVKIDAVRIYLQGTIAPQI
ncbi:MAG: hypothetical protein JXX29_09735 [Deltaproteobacteria bacterium]|nr:hypothetical protein [Deltaproteobacteria bacterium]MBN2671946.1 hypothetical protein [Deltaproteobacteria bacterium]